MQYAGCAGRAIFVRCYRIILVSSYFSIIVGNDRTVFEQSQATIFLLILDKGILLQQVRIQ